MTESLMLGTYATASIGHSNDSGVVIGLGLTTITAESTFTSSLELNGASTINDYDSGSGQLILSPSSVIDLYDNNGEHQTGFYGANGSLAISDLENENSELALFGTRIGSGIQHQGIGVYGAIAFSHAIDQQFAIGTGFYSLHSDGTMVSSFEFNTPSTTNNSGWVDSGVYSVLGSGYAEFELDSGSSPVGYIGGNGSLVAAEMDPVKPGLTIIGTKLTYQFDPAAAVGTYGVSVFGNGYFSGKSLLTLTEEQTWSRTMQINSENVTSINTIVDSGTYSVDGQGNLEIFSNSDEASWSVGYIGENGIIIAAELTPSENPVGFFGVKILTSTQSEGVSGNSGGGLNDPISGGYDDDVLFGSSEHDVIEGFQGDDTLRGAEGDDTLDGGDGRDTALYSGPSRDYQLTRIDNFRLEIHDNIGTDGTDQLYYIERLQFSDKKIAVDVTGNALVTLQYIGVIAPALQSDLSIRGSVLSYFDQGRSLNEACQLALDAGWIPSEKTNLIKAAYKNVIGSSVDPDQATIDVLSPYVDQLGSAGFLAAVAALNINVDIVGLQQNGMEYI